MPIAAPPNPGLPVKIDDMWAYIPPATALLAIVLLVHIVRTRYRAGLRQLPGPFFASFTNLWRLYDVYKGRHQDTLIRLHRQHHSDLVRVGPNAVSVADPEAVKLLYGLRSGFKKSQFYHVQQNVSDGKPLENIFNTTRDDFHAAIKRPVAHAYSMMSLVQYEPFVDTTSQLFCRRLAEEYVGEKKICDLGKWLQYYAFDVIGEITFSRRLGFLETGEDVEGIIKDIEWNLGYFAVIGQLPLLDRFLLKNPLLMKLKLLSANHIIRFTLEQVQARISKPSERKDFLESFLQAHNDNPQLVNERQVLSYTNTNVFAGSDTTAISLRSILYYMLKNPRVMERVLAEIDAVVGDRDCEAAPVSYNESNEMPYFQAVMKEAMRMHPAVGLLLERVVPPDGIEVAGRWLPGGTVVGICPWVLHRDQRVFGPDADSFRPERWLEADPDTLKIMHRSNLAFGAGSRNCIGKHISMLEMSKIVPQLLWKFKFELAHPTEEWSLDNKWFVKQSNFHVYVTERQRR